MGAREKKNNPSLRNLRPHLRGGETDQKTEGRKEGGPAKGYEFHISVGGKGPEKRKAKLLDVVTKEHLN